MLPFLFLASAAFALPHPVRGDFDHDGRMDTAKLVATRSGGFSLVIVRAAQPTQPVTVYRLQSVGDFYIAKAGHGVWKTACGKGYGPDMDHCKRNYVRLRGDILGFGQREASDAIALWNGRRFEVVWITD